MNPTKIRQRLTLNKRTSSPSYNQSASTLEFNTRKFKRSGSRQNSLKTSRSQSKDSESSSISKFFVKKLQKEPPSSAIIDKALKNQNQPKDTDKNISSIQMTNKNQKIKQRISTPAKAMSNEINKTHGTNPEAKHQTVFLEIKLLQLEKKLKSQNRQKINFQKTIGELQNTISNLKVQNIRLVNDIQNLRKQAKQYVQKIRNLQCAAENNRLTVSLAKSNMDKIKQTIKDNRLFQIKEQIKEMERQVNYLSQEKRKMQLRIQELQVVNSQQAQKIVHLKRQLSQQNLSGRQTSRQQFLLRQIEELNRQLSKQKGENQKLIQVELSKTKTDLYEAQKQISVLNMKRDLDEIKKQKEIQMKCQQKEEDIAIWKKKYRVLLQKFKLQFNSQMGPSKASDYQKYLTQSERVVPSKRCNRFSDQELNVQLQLSPQEK